jgi:hypothetical protein
MENNQCSRKTFPGEQSLVFCATRFFQELKNKDLVINEAFGMPGNCFITANFE